MPNDILIAQAISEFPSEESPAFVAVPVQVLESLLKEVQGLRSEVASLQANSQEQASKLVALQNRIGMRLDATEDRLFAEIAQERKRISKLEAPKVPEDSPILDELCKEMKAQGRKQVDFATAARMVKRSKSRMLQLKPAIGQDMRFILVPSESHKQKMIIRLREVK